MLESMKPKISFVMTYCTVEKDKHLLLDIKDWISQTDSEEIRKSTIAVINNINKHCTEPHAMPTRPYKTSRIYTTHLTQPTTT